MIFGDLSEDLRILLNVIHEHFGVNLDRFLVKSSLDLPGGIAVLAGRNGEGNGVADRFLDTGDMKVGRSVQVSDGFEKLHFMLDTVGRNLPNPLPCKGLQHSESFLADFGGNHTLDLFCLPTLLASRMLEKVDGQ